MRSTAVTLIGCLAAASLSLAVAVPAEAQLTGSTLKSGTPRVIRLAPIPPTTSIPLDASLGAWRGEDSHIAGAAHYDSGEWIYEDYPFSAYGAALPGVAQAFEGLEVLGTAVPQSQRLPGGLAEVQAPAGAGPLVDEADLSELRVTVRGSDLYVLARTTTMRARVRTALLLLFDTGRGGVSRAVPFGSGLQTSRADTAALVTGAGTRIVDLVTGHTTAAPAVANPTGYADALETRLPLRLLTGPGSSEVGLVAATGLTAPGAYTLESGGAAGPVAKVAPRFGEPVQAVYDRSQALALAAHDIDRFFTAISLDRLRRGDRQRLLPGVGYNVRTVTAPIAISSEGATDGTLRDYGLYVPRGFSGRPTPATLLLRGSGMTAHSLAAITPALFQQLGDDNGAIVISPGGRSGFDLFEGAAYLDARQALDDARTRLSIQPNRLTVAGYSMGGYATYMFAATQPDRFAGAFVIEGPVGGMQPATALNGLPDVVPSLANLLYTPIEIYQGEHDANVPVTNALAAAQRLRDLGLRYRLNLFPGDHFTPGILNDYTIGAQYLSRAQRVVDPGEVRFSRVMPYEHAVDTGLDSDQPLAGHSVGLRFDHAWYVRDLEASDPVRGTATIDVRTLARPSGKVTPVRTLGVDRGDVGGEPPSLFDEQHWQTRPMTAAPRNALHARLSGTSRVALDLARMGLNAARPLSASIGTDAHTTVALELPRPTCVTFSVDGAAPSRPTPVRSMVAALMPGDHHIELRPCRSHLRTTKGRAARRARSRLTG